MNKIFVINGIDGSGKSTLVDNINNNYGDYIALERHSKETYGIDVRLLDNMTLENTFGRTLEPKF